MERSSLPPSVKKWVPTIIAIVITLVFATLAFLRADLTDNSFLTSLEMRWIDQKFILRGEKRPGPEVVIVGIDDKTLGTVGSFRTLSHDKYAKVIDNLSAAQAKVIGFDVLFPDADANRENDATLADSIQRAGNVVLGVYLDLKSGGPPSQVVDSTELTPELLELSRQKNVFPVNRCLHEPCAFNSLIEGQTLQLALPELTAAAVTFGFVNFHPDAEGRLRHQPQFINYKGALYPSLDLQILRTYLAKGDIIPFLDGNLIRDVQLGGTRLIPVDQFGRYMLNFLGKGGAGEGGTHRIVSMIDVMNGEVKADVLKDKIVLIGAEAVGLGDIRPTPFDPVYNGVELHADVIDNILRQDFLTRNGGIAALDVLVIVIFGTLLAFAIPRVNASRAIIYSVLLLVLFTVVNILAFTSGNLVLGYIYPGMSLVFVSGGLISYQYLTEEREKKRTKSTFQFYLDPHMIEQVMSDPERLRLGGEKREMSVLFSDIRGFTSFSEKMAPTEVVHFLNQYFDKMTGLIFQYKGTLDKLIGDAVMCFWGHPLDMKDHAVKATVCALEMIQAVEDLRPVLILPGGARFDIGVGVNTGQMVVGNMGSQSRFSYTVMGDNVNLGSRLESLNKYYGTKILISDSTYEECRHAIFCRQLDTIQVKGKTDAVTIYEPLAVKRPVDDRRAIPDRRGPPTLQKRLKKAYVLIRYGERRQQERRLGSERLFLKPEQEEIASMYEHALRLYRKADFDAADRAFDHVLKLSPSDGPSRLMKSRIHKFRTEHAGAQAAFDPVYKFDEK